MRRHGKLAAYLPTTYCLPPTAYCLLPTAYCLLPTVYCLLPTRYVATANSEDGSCVYDVHGCTEKNSLNYDSVATVSYLTLALSLSLHLPLTLPLRLTLTPP